MASNYNRKSASSGSRRPPAGRPSRSPSARPARSAAAGSSRLQSVRVGDLSQASRANRAQQTYQRYLLRLAAVAGILVAFAITALIVYNSPAFTIESVSVKGVEHLTASDMQQLAAVDSGTTLLRVDTATIKDNLRKDAWVADVKVNRVFPSTLEIVVTERTIAAVVEVPSESAKTTTSWAIASDGMWLMPIPDKDSEAGQRTSQKVYEDAESVLRITDVPYGTKPQIGSYCSDANVNNALAIVAGMTTELADRISSVKATETESTTLTITNGPDIVFGTADNIREKERVCLEIMKEHPDGVTYINVRTPDRPTWRSV